MTGRHDLRRRRVLALGRSCQAAWLVAAAAVLSGCGAFGNAGAPAAPTTTAFSMATTLTAPPTVPTTTLPPFTCGPLTATDVAKALRVSVTQVHPIADPTLPGVPPCAFRSGEWSISSDVEYPPPNTDLSDDPAQHLPPVPGVAIPSAYIVQLQRGGHFRGQASLPAGDRAIVIWVSNDAEGPDTWAKSPGPLQWPRTQQVTIAVAQQVASKF